VTDTVDGVRVADVRTDGEDVAPAGAQPFGLLVEPVFVHIGHDHAHPVGDEGLGDGQSDPAGGTCHHGNPALE
jgi:hypothetical protein